MSAEIVNLRQARRARARNARAIEADANRARHGRTRADRSAQTQEQTRIARTLDGHRREQAPDEEA